jgi:3-methyladenine DNA glycosylase AlkD
LWGTGNHDARVLATMIADPARLDDRTVEAWGKDLDNNVLTDAFTGLVARSPFAERKMRKWTRSRQEWLGSAGWSLVAHLGRDGKRLDEDRCLGFLESIETEIHGSKNHVRYAMNNALIAIGMMNPRLEKLAVAAAGRIGPVEVDHGETGCKTPDAAAYIARAKSRRRSRAS